MTVEEQVRDALAAQRPMAGAKRDLADTAVRGARRRRAGHAAAAVVTVAAAVAGIAVAIPMLPGQANDEGGQVVAGGPPLAELLAGLPVGEPTSMGAVAASRFTAPGGATMEVPIEPGQELAVVLAVPSGGWLAQAVRGSAVEALWHVGADGAARTLATGGGMSFAVDESGERVAVGTASGLEIVSIATGDTLTSAPPLPRDFSVGGWAGDRILVVGAPGDTRMDVWDPAAGPYSGVPSDRGVFPIGQPHSPDELLAGRPNLTGTSLCVVRVALPSLTPGVEVCGEAGPLGWAGISPDGRTLHVWDMNGSGFAADLDAAFTTGSLEPTRLALPAGVEPHGTWWETERTVLLDAEPRDLPMRDSLDLVRCDVVTGACERVPRPAVANAPAERIVVGTRLG